MLHQTGKYSIVILASLMLGACSTADIEEYASGGSASRTAAGPVRHVATSRVKIYHSGERLPVKYQRIGRVRASNDNVLGIPHSQETVESELKSQAAKIGANAIINIHEGLESTSGEAIRTVT